MEKAAALYEAALASARDIGDRRLECITRCNLGWLKRMDEKFDEARPPLDAALTMARDMGFAHVECVVLFNLGIVCGRLGHFDDATKHLEGTLQLARESATGLVRLKTGESDGRRTGEELRPSATANPHPLP